MNNPFEVINTRLCNIENLILDIKHKSRSLENNDTKERLLSVQGAAKFLNLTVPTIYSKVSKGELPVMKRGKRLYFSTDELLAYIKEGRKATNIEVAENAVSYLTKKRGQ